MRPNERTKWVSSERVSTAEQADRELSLPAQHQAIVSFAARHGAIIDRDYVEAGASGTDPQRPVLQRLLGDALQPSSTISTIVVHHTSRFTRDATHARVVKSKLRKAGVKVLSVLQEFTDDPMGKLMEGFFECIDQYESELNRLRTAAAMREAVRQGFWPGARAPYGFRSVPVEVRPGILHHRLEVEPAEVEVVREAFKNYISQAGSKTVARTLNQRGYRTRSGALWSKNRIMWFLEHEVVAGTIWWGRRKGKGTRPKDEWLALKVEPIIDAVTWALAQKLRKEREPNRAPGRAPSKPQLLKGLAWCGQCGASYQYETGAKTVINGKYKYGYYNCRSTLRIGKEACAGFRISTRTLDEGVLAAVAEQVCTDVRARLIASRHGWPLEKVLEAWRQLVGTHEVGRAYVLHLIERIEVHGERIVVTPRVGGRNETAAVIDG